MISYYCDEANQNKKDAYSDKRKLKNLQFKEFKIIAIAKFNYNRDYFPKNNLQRLMDIKLL